MYPVTSLGPIDKTIYHLYFVLDQGHHSLDAIEAYSKLFNVNYVQAKGVLNDKRVLIATGSAHDTINFIKKSSHFHSVMVPLCKTCISPTRTIDPLPSLKMCIRDRFIILRH